MIDFARVVLNLRGVGMTTRQIAKHVGCSASNVTRITTETGSPRMGVALRLLDLHYDRCPNRHRVEVIGRP